MDLVNARHRLCNRIMPSCDSYKIHLKRQIFYVILKQYILSGQMIAYREASDVFLSIKVEAITYIIGLVTNDSK
jgi:hypothetical protein